MHRQKVAEVEKLTQTVRELEEAVLSGGAAANAVRDYQRKVQEMNVIIAIIEILFNCFVALSLLCTPFVLEYKRTKKTTSHPLRKLVKSFNFLDISINLIAFPKLPSMGTGSMEIRVTGKYNPKLI